MTAIARFLKPSRLKLVFIAEWSAFSILLGLQVGTLAQRQIANLLWPLALYYLCGCIFVNVRNSGHQVLRHFRYLSLIALILAGLDHGMKAWVYTRLSLGESISIIPNHLHLSHTQNNAGSWVLATLDSGPGLKLILILVALVVLLLAPLVYRFYVHTYRRSYWPAIAYIGFAAGMLSWVVDIAIRGVVVDYITMPGVVTADFKDILLSFGIAAFFVEAIENPAISARWKGWRTEYSQFRELIASFKRFVVGEFFGANRIR